MCVYAHVCVLTCASVSVYVYLNPSYIGTVPGLL